MSPDLCIELLQQALWLTLILILPPLLAAFAVGVVMGMFQVSTGVHDASIANVPRLLAALLAMAIALPWVVAELEEFAVLLFGVLHQIQV